MEQARAQLATYFDWLENRGLTGSFAFNQPTHESREAPVETPPRVSHGTGGMTSGPTALPAQTWRVGFYSSSDMTEEEFTMVTKIALALGLPADDFRIWADDSLISVPGELLNSPFIVALGPGSGQTLLEMGQTVAMNALQKTQQGITLLTIPHPRAMLKEPPLKAGAWAALQKLKTLVMPQA